MERGKFKKLTEADELSISTRKLLSLAAKKEKLISKSGQTACRARMGKERKLCLMQSKKSAKTAHMNMLKNLRQKCQHTKDENECDGHFQYQIMRLTSEVKNIDAALRKWKQTIK